MAITNNAQSVNGFDKELLLIGEGYVARPVTLNKDTITGLAADEAGRFIIPQGTYLYGATGESLLVNPQQNAVAVVPTVTKSTGTINTILTVTSKREGAVADVITLAVGTDSTFAVAVGGTGLAKTIDVTLPVDSLGNVTATYEDVVNKINGDVEANSFDVASIAAGADGTTTAAAGTVTLAGGGAETVTSDIDGVLYHSVDVTLGESNGAMIIAGYIDVDKMPSVPGAAVKAKLPKITFARKD